MKSLLTATGMICLLGICNFAQATVSPDRTRIIFNASNKSATVRLTNQSKIDPYLAQSWIEDASGKKTRDFISTLPPMERIEANEQVQIRLMALASLNNLPQDRETVFYYNVREIPPRAKEQNVMQIAMQSRLKLFWRPKAIELKDGEAVPVQKVTVARSANGLTLNNPTPYHITVGYIGTNGKTLMPGTDSIMVTPFGTATQQIKNLPATFLLGFVGDYGGLEMFKIDCNSVQSLCQTSPAKKGNL
ncbi:fimbrial biogenesis chaperone [Escherichia fergusonii]|uniref:fimbrial biogenesis chaperone n=1 Tax=Escherichia fergusonii TaxID=564 RepID=UPI00359F7CCC